MDSEKHANRGNHAEDEVIRHMAVHYAGVRGKHGDLRCL